MQDFADRIIADEELPQHPDAEQAQELMLEGTSIGGARPKAVVEDENGLWIAKLNRPDDKWNHARVERAMLELFRRMCFNALISNSDDHPRNHAVIAMEKEWNLSPAYDLTPST